MCSFTLDLRELEDVKNRNRPLISMGYKKKEKIIPWQGFCSVKAKAGLLPFVDIEWLNDPMTQ